MSRKDFELIAKVIREAKGIDDTQRECLAKDFADALLATNARFKWARFVMAATRED